jgi:hypothetical protein
MNEQVSEIVLRLARQQLAAERGAEGQSIVMFPQASAPQEFLPAAAHGLPAADSKGHEFETTAISSTEPSHPLVRTGGEVEGAVEFEIALSDVADSRANASSSDGTIASSTVVPSEVDEHFTAPATEDRTSLFPGLTGNQSHPPCPPLRRGGGDRATRADQSDAGAHSQVLDAIIERIGDHGRRLDDALGELERSLAGLFASQTETLNHLRDRVLEHDRRWLEQSANRRAAFAP